MSIKNTSGNDTSGKLLQAAVEALREKQGRDIAVWDVRGVSGVTDYYLLTTALAAPHLKALCNAVRIALKEQEALCFRKSGTPESGWIVMDYLDLVIHFFTREMREYYAMEELWAKLPRMDV